jgi:thioredoxin 1
MMPILDELRKDYAGRLDVVFYDVYKHRDKAMQSRIRVIPTQLFVGPDGNEFFRHEGFFPKEDILARFTEHGIALGKTKPPGAGAR